jgi:hypothetical protein
MEMTMYNGGKWTGEVVAINKEMKKGFNVHLKVETVSARDNEVYTDVLPVRIEDAKAMLKVEEGKKLSFNGIFNTFDVTENGRKTKSTVIHADPSTVTQPEDDAAYENFVMLTGELRDKTCRNATGDKQAWGFCLMQVAGKLFRASLFRNVLVTMDREVTRGSNVQHGGPARYREFDNNGRKGKMLEVLSQEDHFKILHTAEIHNPISGYTPFNPDKKSKK